MRKHSHEHSHSHSHSLNSENIDKSFLIGILLNVVYAVAELFWGWKINSTSLVSDAIHNFGDVSGLLLAYIAFRLQKIKPSGNFSYGYKKISILASFANSLVLAIGIGIIFYEGVDKLIHPQPIDGKTVMIIAAGGIVINTISALFFRKEQDHDLNIKAAYWHLLSDAMLSVGVVISGLIIWLTGWYPIDGVIAILIAIVVLYNTWELFKDSLIAVLDGKPKAIDWNEIQQHLLENPNVKDIHHVHIWGLSTNENALTAHVVVDNFSEIPQIKHQIKHILEDHNIAHSTLEFEVNTEHCSDQ